MALPVTRRILLGLNAGQPAKTEIVLAARLAESLQAAIHGLLIEEQGLMDAASLPFTRITARAGTRAPDFTSVALERAFGLAERACRDTICMMAASARVQWTMQRERGELVTTLQLRTETGDIVIMPGSAGAAAGRPTIADIRLIAGRAIAVLMMQAARSSLPIEAGPVVAIDDGDIAGAVTVGLAAQIASGMDRPLHVIVLGRTMADAEAIERCAREAAWHRQAMRFHQLAPDQTDAIALKLRMLAPSLVVANIEADPLRSDATVLDLQRASSAPFLLLGRAAHTATS